MIFSASATAEVTTAVAFVNPSSEKISTVGTAEEIVTTEEAAIEVEGIETGIEVERIGSIDIKVEERETGIEERETEIEVEERETGIEVERMELVVAVRGSDVGTLVLEATEMKAVLDEELVDLSDKVEVDSTRLDVLEVISANLSTTFPTIVLPKPTEVWSAALSAKAVLVSAAHS